MQTGALWDLGDHPTRQTPHIEAQYEDALHPSHLVHFLSEKYFLKELSKFTLEISNFNLAAFFVYLKVNICRGSQTS